MSTFDTLPTDFRLSVSYVARIARIDAPVEPDHPDVLTAVSGLAPAVAGSAVTVFGPPVRRAAAPPGPRHGAALGARGGRVDAGVEVRWERHPSRSIAGAPGDRARPSPTCCRGSRGTRRAASSAGTATGWPGRWWCAWWIPDSTTCRGGWRSRSPTEAAVVSAVGARPTPIAAWRRTFAVGLFPERRGAADPGVHRRARARRAPGWWRAAPGAVGQGARDRRERCGRRGGRLGARRRPGRVRAASCNPRATRSPCRRPDGGRPDGRACSTAPDATRHRPVTPDVDPLWDLPLETVRARPHRGHRGVAHRSQLPPRLSRRDTGEPGKPDLPAPRPADVGRPQDRLTRQPQERSHARVPGPRRHTSRR